VRILLWHVHGSWTTSFVQGGHDYLLPVLADRGPDGLGRARTWEWPQSVVEVDLGQVSRADVDLVVLQRPHEAELLERSCGLRAGRDVPAVYVEHNCPSGAVPDTVHPLADRSDIPVAHVTHFNALFWDCGQAPTTVIEHGVVDPGLRYTGELARAAVVTNDPVRRWRTVGADLFETFAAVAPLDVFGMRVDALPAATGLGADALTPYEDLPQERMHAAVAQRRLYLHTTRWTSLGLALIEAMQLGLPVVAVASTEAARAVPPEAGVVSANPQELVAAMRALLAEPERAAAVGREARRAALDRYGLPRFLSDWDRLCEQVLR